MITLFSASPYHPDWHPSSSNKQSLPVCLFQVSRGIVLRIIGLHDRPALAHSRAERKNRDTRRVAVGNPPGQIANKMVWPRQMPLHMPRFCNLRRASANRPRVSRNENRDNLPASSPQIRHSMLTQSTCTGRRSCSRHTASRRTSRYGPVQPGMSKRELFRPAGNSVSRDTLPARLLHWPTGA